VLGNALMCAAPPLRPSAPCHSGRGRLPCRRTKLQPHVGHIYLHIYAEVWHHPIFCYLEVLE